MKIAEKLLLGWLAFMFGATLMVLIAGMPWPIAVLLAITLSLFGWHAATAGDGDPYD